MASRGRITAKIGVCQFESASPIGEYSYYYYELTMEHYLKELEAALKVITTKLHEELRAIRSNRPSVELVENIQVNYYDQMMPVKQLGSLSIGSSKEIQITVWDKNALAPVMGAIQAANIGLSLQNDGATIRAFLPPLSSERREELGKVVKKAAEAKRIEIRARRDEVLKKDKAAEEEKELTEDQIFKLKESVQKLIDEGNKEVEQLVENKIKELAD